MTLDQRIRNDLGDLYNKLPINAAVSLNNCCKTPSNSYPFQPMAFQLILRVTEMQKQFLSC